MQDNQNRKRARLFLKKQYEEIQNTELNVSVGLEGDDMFTWRLCFGGPPGTPYQEGLYSAILSFPDDYPNMPPKMRFISEMFHPNIYPNGQVCISILHPPVVDETNPFEKMQEKWKPVLGPETILLSVISMLVDPNLESPANIDAGIMFRDNRQAYNTKVRQLAAKSLSK